MIVPVQMALVPLLTIFRELGIANGFGGIWLAHTAFGLPLGIFCCAISSSHCRAT